MNVTLCWTHISGYMAACWRALAALDGIELNIIAFKSDSPGSTIAFKDDVVGDLKCRLLNIDEQQNQELIHKLVAETKPDVVTVPGWFYPPYTSMTKNPALSQAKFLLTMDTPRQDTLRQKLGKYKIAGLLKRIDCVIVAGERAWQLAKLLRVPENKIRRGLYGVDYASLSPLYQKRATSWPKKFLFTGRYVEEKGVDILLDGYARYRKQSRDPWPLTCCGAGPLESTLNNQPGVSNRGFVQPKDQREILAGHGVFVLPSLFDPWPLAIVEAAASGLPVIHSEACGSAVETVRSYYSGIGVSTGDPQALCNAMLWCDAHASELPEMGRRAQALAEPFSAQQWALRWKTIFQEII